MSGRELKIYTYAKCDTCRKATRFLAAMGLDYKEIPIRETPPSKEELTKMLSAVGELRKLFNTSGRDYKDLGLSSQLESLGEEKAMQLLLKNGNLVKRPFLIGPQVALVGFQEAVWRQNLQKI